MKKWITKSKDGFDFISDGSTDIFITFYPSDQATYIADCLNEQNIEYNDPEFSKHFYAAYHEYRNIYEGMLNKL